MMAETRDLPPAIDLQAVASAAPEIPQEIGFHNRIAVRIAFIGALNSLLLFFLLSPIPLLALSLTQRVPGRGRGLHAEWAALTVAGPRAWLALGYMVVLGTIVAMSLWSSLLARYPADRVTPSAQTCLRNKLQKAEPRPMPGSSPSACFDGRRVNWILISA